MLIILHSKNVFVCIIQSNFPLFNVYVQFNLFHEYMYALFLIQMKYRLHSMYNHMVGRAASCPSPLCSILLCAEPTPGKTSRVWTRGIKI